MASEPLDLDVQRSEPALQLAESATELRLCMRDEVRERCVGVESERGGRVMRCERPGEFHFAEHGNTVVDLVDGEPQKARLSRLEEKDRLDEPEDEVLQNRDLPVEHDGEGYDRVAVGWRVRWRADGTTS